MLPPAPPPVSVMAEFNKLNAHTAKSVIDRVISPVPAISAVTPNNTNSVSNNGTAFKFSGASITNINTNINTEGARALTEDARMRSFTLIPHVINPPTHIVFVKSHVLKSVAVLNSLSPLIPVRSPNNDQKAKTEQITSYNTTMVNTKTNTNGILPPAPLGEFLNPIRRQTVVSPYTAYSTRDLPPSLKSESNLTPNIPLVTPDAVRIGFIIPSFVMRVVMCELVREVSGADVEMEMVTNDQSKLVPLGMVL